MSTDADSGAIAHLVTTEDSAIGEGPPSPTINIGGQSPTSPEDDDVPRILVTGASGYIATTLIKILLKDGRFRVRGTVRNKQRKEKASSFCVDVVFDISPHPLDGMIDYCQNQMPCPWGMVSSSNPHVDPNGDSAQSRMPHPSGLFLRSNAVKSPPPPSPLPCPSMG